MLLRNRLAELHLVLDERIELHGIGFFVQKPAYKCLLLGSCQYEIIAEIVDISTGTYVFFVTEID